jgi:hypothetical protein
MGFRVGSNRQRLGARPEFIKRYSIASLSVGKKLAFGRREMRDPSSNFCHLLDFVFVSDWFEIVRGIAAAPCSRCINVATELESKR